ncbi:MAG: DUF192 domain-containing protein [Ignavibacteriales bacterium]|nr:DUF192 domain-containing protein [Ignavibacteriales bacterium]
MSKKQKPANVAATGAKGQRNTIAIVGTILLILVLVAVLTIQPGGKPVSTYTPRAEPSQPTAYMFKKQGELRFLTPKQDFIVDIELAQNDSQRQLGLMYRDTLAENQGMLFVFDNEEVRAFWMKNTILSLDMIFVNAHNEIVTIHKYTTPYSEESYESTKPAKYVIEVNAGYADKRKISVGDRVSWSRF